MTSKEVKDLKIKIGTPDEVMWTDLKTTTEQMLEGQEKSIKINKEILKLCNIKIAEEKEKLK